MRAAQGVRPATDYIFILLYFILHYILSYLLSYYPPQCGLLKACGRLYAEMGEEGDKLLPFVEVGGRSFHDIVRFHDVVGFSSITHGHGRRAAALGRGGGPRSGPCMMLLASMILLAFITHGEGDELLPLVEVVGGGGRRAVSPVRPVRSFTRSHNI